MKYTDLSIQDRQDILRRVQSETGRDPQIVEKDYQSMQESMIYEESPSFDQLIETLTALNRRINALSY